MEAATKEGVGCCVDFDDDRVLRGLAPGVSNLGYPMSLDRHLLRPAVYHGQVPRLRRRHRGKNGMGDRVRGAEEVEAETGNRRRMAEEQRGGRGETRGERGNRRVNETTRGDGGDQYTGAGDVDDALVDTGHLSLPRLPPRDPTSPRPHSTCPRSPSCPSALRRPDGLGLRDGHSLRSDRRPAAGSRSDCRVAPLLSPVRCPCRSALS